MHRRALRELSAPTAFARSRSLACVRAIRSAPLPLARASFGADQFTSSAHLASELEKVAKVYGERERERESKAQKSLGAWRAPVTRCLLSLWRALSAELIERVASWPNNHYDYD